LRPGPRVVHEVRGRGLLPALSAPTAAPAGAAPAGPGGSGRGGHPLGSGVPGIDRRAPPRRPAGTAGRGAGRCGAGAGAAFVRTWTPAAGSAGARGAAGTRGTRVLARSLTGGPGGAPDAGGAAGTTARGTIRSLRRAAGRASRIAHGSCSLSFGGTDGARRGGARPLSMNTATGRWERFVGESHRVSTTPATPLTSSSHDARGASPLAV